MRKKIILAPDSFKESLSAARVCDAMERGVRRLQPEANIVKCPLADGGEGTVDALVSATNGSLVKKQVVGPCGKPVWAQFGLLGDGATAVIEMASASGLPLLPLHERNPLHTTSFGTGQLLQAALEYGVSELIVGIGGSATNDCGAGMAQALGVRFYDDESMISDYMTGGLMNKVRDIDISHLDARLAKVTIKVACDVNIPLLGERGASRLYAPQKGAAPAVVEQLEENMHHIIALIEKETRPVRTEPGAGAAGGLGAGLMAFLNAELSSGIDLVLDACRFEEHIQDADVILTGEGQIDAQSAMGKTISGVLKRAAIYHVPVIAIGGALLDSADALFDLGLSSMFCICDRPMALERAILEAEGLIEKTVSQIVRLVLPAS